MCRLPVGEGKTSLKLSSNESKSDGYRNDLKIMLQRQRLERRHAQQAGILLEELLLHRHDYVLSLSFFVFRPSPGFLRVVRRIRRVATSSRNWSKISSWRKAPSSATSPGPTFGERSCRWLELELKYSCKVRHTLFFGHFEVLVV